MHVVDRFLGSVAGTIIDFSLELTLVSTILIAILVLVGIFDAALLYQIGGTL
jgi:hypothetical protein